MMEADMAAASRGWLPTGYQAWVALWIWGIAVVAHGFVWRSLFRPEPDAPRDSGPI